MPTWIKLNYYVFCPQIVIVRFVSQNEQQIYSIYWIIFMNEMESAYCEVRTESINKTDYISSLIGQNSAGFFAFTRFS
jgi:hypothetical protein